MLDFTGTLPQVRKLNDGNCCHAEAEGGSDVRVAPAQYCANLFLNFFLKYETICIIIFCPIRHHIYYLASIMFK